MSTRHLERAVSIVIALAAVSIAVVAVHREFAPAPVSSPSEIASVEEWQDAIPLGRIAGNPNASVKVVEFADFECPFCKKYHSTLMAIRQEHPDDVAVVLVHFPLASHRFAVPAAIASECAHQQGRFWEMVEALYARQDSFGLVSWADYAVRAGVGDTVTYTSCLRDSLPRMPVEKGAEFARRLGLDGTPTILVNGWRFPSPPSLSHLNRAVAAVKAGKKPEIP